MLQNIDFSYLINVSIGILFSLIIGFFILRAVISAIAFATDYEGKKETLEEAKKSLTAAVKGVVIALGTFIFLNFILSLLGIAPIENPGEYIEKKLDNLYVCLYNYSLCGVPGVDIDNLPPNVRYKIDPFEIVYNQYTNSTSLSSYDSARDPSDYFSEVPPDIVPEIEGPKEPSNITKKIKGNYYAVYTYGAGTHHYGLSQWGAKGRAADGFNYRQIIEFYYKSSVVKKPEYRNLNIKTTTSREFPIEEYLLGIYGEMPASFGEEALKAQAVAARSYVVKRTAQGTNPICVDARCQVFGNPSNANRSWKKAVEDTKNEFIKDDNGAGFQYSALSGGYVYPGGFDLDKDANPQVWPKDAYENILNKKSFYNSWISATHIASAIKGECGVNSSWLSKAEVADLLNAYKFYAKGGSRDYIGYTSGCTYPSGYNLNDLKSKVDQPVNEVNSIILRRVLNPEAPPNQILTNSSLTFQTDKGDITLSFKDFKTIYNIRAKGGLNISSNIINIESDEASERF
jgi:SpoIID/LytB domain protein